MIKYILAIVVSASIISCSDYKYPENIKVSERSGALVDSAASYLSDELTFDGITHVMLWNKEILEQVNNYYRMTSEPILYNYYIGHNIYRLVIVEKGKESLVLSVNKDSKRAWIVSKRIKKQETLNVDSTNVSPTLSSSFDHFTRDMSDEEWAKFEKLWEAADFYHQTNHEVDKSFDNYCVVEAHEERKYWYVYRSSDNALLKELSAYVLSLTRFNV